MQQTALSTDGRFKDSVQSELLVSTHIWTLPVVPHTALRSPALKIAATNRYHT